MRTIMYVLTASLIGAIALGSISCGSEKKEMKEEPATRTEKIPVTTSSDVAMKSFLQGRELAEKLRGQESLRYFEQAIAEDHDFAMAHLYLALFSPSAKAFFENLNRAVALAENVTEAERLWIRGVEAGANGLPMEQRKYYRSLVMAYPNDERAHTLLGNHYFGQQEWDLAIGEFTQAIQINPEYSQPYNQLGYAHRFLGNYSEAEQAFKKYIELIPDDPNPYDSYAELLMKMGRFEDSIASYRKALEQNPNFVASHIGIATNYNFLGEHARAREQLEKLYEIARNDGERRAAHFARTVSYVDEGDMKHALGELQKQFQLAKGIDDAAAMSGDLTVMGNILLENDKPDAAREKFQEALRIMENSNLSQEVKDNARRGYLYNMARVALRKHDLDRAREHSSEFHRKVTEVNSPLQIKLAHELEGRIAIEEANYDRALEELHQANLQNPYNLYRISLAYEKKGEKDKAREYCRQAAGFNALNSLNYAYIRTKAGNMLNSM